MKRIILILAISTQLSGCLAILGGGSWVAAHTVEIGQVALVAGAVASVESVAVNGIALQKELAPAK